MEPKDTPEFEAKPRAAGLRARSLSFYLLPLIPVVMLLSLHTLLDPGAPGRVAFGLVCLFLFLAVAFQRACMDLFEILRGQLRESRLSFQETLGEPKFVEGLGRRKPAAGQNGAQHDG